MNWNSGLLPIEAWMVADAPPPRPPSPDEAKQPRPLPEQARLIDVRSYAEYMEGHLPGAHCLPLPQLGHLIHALVPERRAALIVYCASGARAELALGLLQRLGYSEVFYGGAAKELAQRLHLGLQRGM